MDVDDEKFGAYRVIDRGDRPPRATMWPRWGVVEDDHLGPILRAGPFATLGEARRAAQALAAADEAADDDSQRRRHDRRNYGDDNYDGPAKPSSRKASGWCL